MPALTLVSCTAVAATSTTVTTQPGDYVLVWAFRDGSNTVPTTPAGWFGSGNSGANTCSETHGWLRASGVSTGTGTWTNASMIVVWVWRNAKKGIFASGNSAVRASTAANGATNSVNFPDNTFQCQDGASILFGVMGHRSIDTNLETCIPAGATQTATLVNATCEVVAWKMDNPQTDNTGPFNFSITGTASGWISRSMEIIPARARIVSVN